MIKRCSLILILVLLLAASIPCAADLSDVDPILLDKPWPTVYECNPDIFIEIPNQAIIDYAIGSHEAKSFFLFFDSEVLYLGNVPWNGLDKSSFMLKHTGEEGSEETFPLNYMLTSYMSMKNNWRTMSSTMGFGFLLYNVLVFDIDENPTEGWSLLFRPAERGGAPSCEIEIPLSINKRR